VTVTDTPKEKDPNDLPEHPMSIRKRAPRTDRFASALLKRRIRIGLTQTQLSEKTGIPTAYISRYERGRVRPQLGSFAKLIMGLGYGPTEAVHLMNVLNEQKPLEKAGTTR